MRTKLTNGSKVNFAIFTSIIAVGILLTHGQDVDDGYLQKQIGRSWEAARNAFECRETYDRLRQLENARHSERTSKIAESRSRWLQRSEETSRSLFRAYLGIANDEKDVARQQAAIRFAGAQATFIACVGISGVTPVRAVLCISAYKATMLAIGVELGRRIEAIETLFDERIDRVEAQGKLRAKEINERYDRILQREMDYHNENLEEIKRRRDECINRF